MLGQLPTVDAERLEAELIEDATLFAAVREAEADLFDDWARGRLSTADRDRFLARFGTDDRLAFARALAARVAAGRPPGSSRSMLRLWLPLAVAAGLLLAVGAAYLIRSRQAPSDAPVARVAAPPAQPVPPALVAMIALGTSRAASGGTTIAVPASAGSIELHVRLDPADRFDRYDMTLRSASNVVVWHGEDLKAAAVNGEAVLVQRVASVLVPDGPYELSVRGGGETGALEDLGFVTLTVTHRR
ncbi:MAG TPA: hypothetical protein VFB07_09710 [Vicinamibacterales bacterium]|nr:hypothetical protein [Vicinamibacterales bacterium]